MNDVEAMTAIAPHELKELISSGKPYQLIDVREAHEAALCTIGGELIPLGEVLEHLDRIRRDVPVVIYCNSGNRSAATVDALCSRHGFSGLMFLAGGIQAYAREVDPSLRCA